MQFVCVMRRRQQRDKQRVATLSFNKRLRDTSNPYLDPDFEQTYRFSGEAALRIATLLKPHYPTSTTAAAIPVELKFLAALHTLAQGSGQKSGCKGIKMSQASISRAITETINALNAPEIMAMWINFPINLDKRSELIDRNYRSYGVPGVVGYVDATHIFITPPKENDEQFVNSKGVHSINVQIACDSSLKILNICARFPGTCQDSFIWESSLLRETMITCYNEGACWLLGDLAYPNEPWLLTPIPNPPPDSPESNYNRLHKKARSCIDHCIGVMKCHWQIINNTKASDYVPLKAAKITNACAVLHNIGLHENIEVTEDEVLLDDMPLEPYTQDKSFEADMEVYSQGLHVRNELVSKLAD